MPAKAAVPDEMETDEKLMAELKLRPLEPGLEPQELELFEPVYLESIET